MKRLSAALVACSTLAGCSGGGGTSLPASQSISSSPGITSVPAAKKRGAAAFTIVIPKAAAASIGRRAVLSVEPGKMRPHYISPGTQSLVVTLTAVNGNPISSPQAYAVNLGGSGCPTSGGQTTCTLVVPTTAGSDLFSIVTYDTAQSSTTPTTPTGNRLSMQTTTVAIAANTANVVSVPLVLDGVVATLGATLGASAYYWHPAQTIPISIEPRDAAGYLVVAPGGYRDTNGNPLTITLSDSDTSGSTSLPTTSISTTSVAANAAVTYNGGPLPNSPPIITVSAPGFASVPMTLTASIKSGTLFVGSSNGTRIYDHSGSISSSTLLETIGSGHVAHGVALGPSGILYQSQESAGTVNEYVPGATTASATLTGLSTPEGIALDSSSNRVYVAQMTTGPAYFTNGSTTVSGTAAEPASPYTYTQNYGVAVDSTGSLYALDDASGGFIYTYPNGLSQSAFREISGVVSESLSFESNGSLLLESGNASLYTYSSSTGFTLLAQNLPTVFGTVQDTAGNVLLSLGDTVDELPHGSTTVTLVINSPGAGFFQIAVAP